MTRRTAIVLFNLGGPGSLDAVEPFLFNLFSDPDIFKLPLGFITQRFFALLIAKRRVGEAKIGYAAIGGRSPLLENTERQAAALQRALAAHAIDVHICMRYWHPMSAEVVAHLKRENYERLVLLPLYPQYSRTTSGSSYNDFKRECERQHYRPQMQFVRQWYDEPRYQRGVVETIEAELKKLSQPDPAATHLLFSAHGLPRKIVDEGDPYEEQIRATYDAVRAHLGWPHTTLSYQSRVGPLEWLKPYTENVVRELAQGGVKQMLVYPIAFVSDHIETLYELGMTYANLAREHGVREYRVVPALNDHPMLIEALKALALDAVKEEARA